MAGRNLPGGKTIGERLATLRHRRFSQEPLYRAFPGFELDPCSPRKTRTRARARGHYTAEDDGLSLPWFGTVFMNPSYGRTLARWVTKAREEAESGRARTVVALLPARPDTSCWHEHILGKSAVYFLKGRLRFSGSERSAPFPPALAVWGADPEAIAALDAAFPEAWRTL